MFSNVISRMNFETLIDNSQGLDPLLERQTNVTTVSMALKKNTLTICHQAASQIVASSKFD